MQSGSTSLLVYTEIAVPIGIKAAIVGSSITRQTNKKMTFVNQTYLSRQKLNLYGNFGFNRYQSLFVIINLKQNAATNNLAHA